MILEVNDIYTSYGLSQILFGISINIEQGECVALLGRNGVGKTTTLRSIMGLTAPKQGSVVYKGNNITGQATFRVAKLGVGYVPEERRIFPDLSVRENLETGRKPAANGSGQNWTIERVHEIFPILEGLSERKGGHLSGGEQQMLTVGRTLMGNPDLLLLDEPSEGLAPLVVRDLAEQISRLKNEGMTILLCEQNAKFATDLSDRAYILEKGQVRFGGTIDELQENEEIRDQYLGL
ncbi:MAG: ABC transporter ATP-binding protein [Rhodospirillaceae bacterium]|jgi:branched-chain amino acid transport system ATP-binding protein|nr:ABC transporter ATP-binding protein [Rhodospirillaceae bacterium]MBT4487846.1 ABC transporter ATP-binding protein [Rhodospirillaceae bacterium]MBT5195485.1 ABC transporter ATP-binding protein [Rhodospirillaceae bacterium]MBT5897986.1 ABC transporter ATP-binding protein [Rhodospirillaceae bacterium]